MWFYRFYPFTTGAAVVPPTPPPAEAGPQLIIGGARASIQRIAERHRLNRKAVEIIEKVAIRQVETLHLDETQRTEELYREFSLSDLQIEARHIEAMNLIRERLIEEEIGRLLRIKLQQREEEELLMLAAVAARLT